MAPALGKSASIDGADPFTFELRHVYPNPFNASTTISFTIPADAVTSLAIYSITGQKICELVSEQLGAGSHTVRWDGMDSAGRLVSSGVYFARLNAGSFSAVQSMAFVK
jgi:flagellar hook assembly protein FlgD